MQIALFVFILGLASLAPAATRFVPANDSQPLIRRDLLPLDVDAIRELADNLALLADGPIPKSADLLRNRVQTLTLSQRLSPTQPRSRTILAAFAERQDRPKPEGKDLKPAKREVLAATNWLAKLPPNSEGHHLGQLLLDILQPIAKEEPVLQLHNSKDSLKRWKGVVSRVNAFEKRDSPVIKEAPKTPTPPTPTPAPKINAPDYEVTALLTDVPMISTGQKDNKLVAPGLIKTSLVITKNRDNGKLRFQPSPETPFDPNAVHQDLQKFFSSRGQTLPPNRNLNINTDGRVYLAKNQQNITAPLAMMLDAALSGRRLRRNTILLAHLRTDGTLAKPASAWELLLDLESLRMPDGTRIIVGPGMVEELTGLLVLEKVAFFNKHEVIEAPTFEDARELFYQDGKPSEALTAAMAGYQEVRAKAILATNLNTFLSLSAVENRLVKARDLSPYHISTHMLATQAIRRPADFSRFMLAQELDRCLEEISQFQYKKNETTERQIREASNETRTLIEPLTRLSQRSEAEILDEADDLLKTLNSVGRGASTLLNNQTQIIENDMKAFQDKLLIFRKKLRQIYQPSKK